MPGLELQPKLEQSKYKISFYYDAAIAPDVNGINNLLHQHEQSANVVLSFGQYLDVVPVRASKGFALRWFADMWGIPVENILAAGGSGADEDMMRGNTKSQTGHLLQASCRLSSIMTFSAITVRW